MTSLMPGSTNQKFAGVLYGMLPTAITYLGGVSVWSVIALRPGRLVNGVPCCPPEGVSANKIQRWSSEQNRWTGPHPLPHDGLVTFAFP